MDDRLRTTLVAAVSLVLALRIGRARWRSTRGVAGRVVRLIAGVLQRLVPADNRVDAYRPAPPRP